MSQFDHLINRQGTNSIKWDLRKGFFGRDDVLPFWVADMDFPVAEEITRALAERAVHPVYGYSALSDGYYNSIIRWLDHRHGWKVEREWISYSPGVVTTLNLLVQTFTRPGDGVIVQPPVYFPFFWAVTKNRRKLLQNELLEENGCYTFNFHDLEKKILDGARMLILCSPHNPVGRAWSEEELKKIINLCVEHNVVLVSDEIHCDLVLLPFRHIPTASLSPEASLQTITCISPSKTFNLAGLATSSVIIANPSWREKFAGIIDRVHFNSNIFGAVASEAAYTHGEKWLDDLIGYLKRNQECLEDFIRQHRIPAMVFPVEATFLAWLDLRPYLSGLSPDNNLLKPCKAGEVSALNRHLVDHGIALVDGRLFGPGGDGFQRLNFGCPRSMLMEGLHKLLAAL